MESIKPMTHDRASSERMRCMEVWGGNRGVDRNFETAGLKVWVYCRPYGEAVSGGDVYYLSSCASGRITRMLLADVSGHGELVSQVAVALRELMRRNVNYVRQTRFVQAMNQEFAEFAEEGGFATALVSTFFSPTQTYALCNAGHPPSSGFSRGHVRMVGAEKRERRPTCREGHPAWNCQ